MEALESCSPDLGLSRLTREEVFRASCPTQPLGLSGRVRGV